MTDGWIKLHRQFSGWGWYTDSKTVHLFIHILLKCNHAPREWRGVTIMPGQFVTSRDKLSVETGISLQSIRTILKRLKSTNEITSKSTNSFTIITVCNWQLYQSGASDINQQTNQQTNKRLTSDQPAINQRLTTNKNDKNIENDKKEKEERERAPVDNFLTKCIECMERKHSINHRQSHQWLTYFRNDVNAMKAQGISESRILAALQWYESNEFFYTIDSGRSLVTHFAALEKASANQSQITNHEGYGL